MEIRMKHMDSIDKLVLAISPETQQVTAYHEVGATQPMLGQPSKPLYRPVNHQGQVHTLAQLKNATYAQGQPVQIYERAKVYKREDEKQEKLW